MDNTTLSTFRLHRSRTDRMIGGVCGGLAESFGVDATLIRIGLVVLTLLGAGAGAVIYVAIWALAPEEDHRAPQVPTDQVPPFAA